MIRSHLIKFTCLQGIVGAFTDTVFFFFFFTGTIEVFCPSFFLLTYA